ncbi:MAG: cell envelope integrity protein TolA [Burkholderiales bacterium]
MNHSTARAGNERVPGLRHGAIPCLAFAIAVLLLLAIRPAAATDLALEHQIAVLEARVQQQLALAKARPRMKFIAGSTAEEPFAGYVKNVRGIVARSPGLEAAGGRGAVVSLAIAAEGMLQSVDLDRSSGSVALDAALRESVRSAAQFPPFPQAVRERADLLVVTLQIPDAVDLTISGHAARAQPDANPCELPFSEMIDSRGTRASVAGRPAVAPRVSHFQLDDARNTAPGISPDDDRRYNYRSRYLVADLDTRHSGGKCKGLEERYPLIDPAHPDFESFPELEDPGTLEHFIRDVQGAAPRRGYFAAPTAKKPVVRMGGTPFCIGQTVSLCEIRRGQPVEIARLGTSSLLSNAGPDRQFYAPMNTIVVKSWMESRKYTSADARRDAALGGIAAGQRSGVLLSRYQPEDVAWVMPNFMQWRPVAGFAHDNTVKGLHELSRGETRINNLGSPVSHGCLRLTRYGAVLARWWTPRGAKLFIHYTTAGYRHTP